MHLAANQGHAKVVEFLALESSEIAACEVDGWNALHLASMNGHIQVVELLVELGV